MIEPRDEPVIPHRATAADREPSGSHPVPASEAATTPATTGEPLHQPAASAGGSADGAAPAEASALSVDQVKLVLRRVKDPELNLNVVDLGLIYDIAVDGATVKIDMSLTSPGCPSGPEIMGDVERQLRTIPEVADVQVNLVWSPYWTPERIEPRVRAYLGF